MSHRKLIFMNGLAYWDCGPLSSYTERETQSSSQGFACRLQGERTRSPTDIAVTTSLEDLAARLEGNFGEYTIRELRFPEDALPRVVGLSSILSQMHGKILYGIPEFFFDRFLAWFPDSGENLERRVSSNEPSHEQLHPSGLPSWSWVRWRGEFKFRESLRFDGLGDEEIWTSPGPRGTMSGKVNGWTETIPVAKWLTRESSNSPWSSLRIDKSSWFQEKEASKRRSHQALPACWLRVNDFDLKSFGETAARDTFFPEDAEEELFAHNSQLKDSKLGYTNFYYFPMASPFVDSERTPSVQTRFLFYRTKKCQLWVRPETTTQVDRDQLRMHTQVCLYNELSEPIGSLQLHHADQINHLARIERDCSGLVPVGVVAINRMKLYEDSWNLYSKPSYLNWQRWREHKSGDKHQVWEAYTALWVEWDKGDVAHRLGIARVNKEDWDRAHPEDISL